MFLIVASKENKDYVKKLVDEFGVNERATLVICSTTSLTTAEQRRMNIEGMLCLTPVELNEYLEHAEATPAEFCKSFSKAIGILAPNGRDFKLEPDVEVYLKAELLATGKICFQIVWPASLYKLLQGEVFPENYTLQSLRLDKTHKIRLIHGAAPIDCLVENVTVHEKAQLLKFAAKDGFTVERGILTVRAERESP